VFAPDTPASRGPRIWNEQLVRYAGYQHPDGTVHGDPRNADLTSLALSLGWPGGDGRFDVLPLVISAGDAPPGLYELPPDVVLEVPLSHPRLAWFAELGLRWHAVPAITDMCLEIGGICYPAAPFNGWYMGTEIGARNLADCDRYNQLPEVAARMGLDMSSDRSLWRDHALIELNEAVLHSFDTAGVAITDHHTESRRFLTWPGKNAPSGPARPTGPGSSRPSPDRPPRCSITTMSRGSCGPTMSGTIAICQGSGLARDDRPYHHETRT
jgi:nitric-oxide synthase